jgi:flagellar basal body rod protein FlgG
MGSISSIALSGMNAAQATLNTTANNIANLNTPGFKRQEVVQSARSGGGVSTSVSTAQTEGSALETDIVTQLQAKNAFMANLAVFKTSNAMAGALLDQKA